MIQSSIVVVLLFQNEEKNKLEDETLATEITASMTRNKMLKSRLGHGLKIFKTIKFCAKRLISQAGLKP